MNDRIPFIPLILLSFLIGCGHYGGDGERKIQYQSPPSESADFMSVSGGTSRQAAKSASISDLVATPAGAQSQAPIPSRRMVIKTADLQLEIGAYETWMARVQNLVEEHEGYIVDASTRQGNQNVKRGKLTVRVPQTDFEKLLEELKGSATKIEGESVGGQDVTEEFFDLEARLGNQKRTEARFQEILKEAKTVEDILAVERELSRVREQIERLEGRRRYLQDRVGMSTVTVTWHEPYPLGGDQRGNSFWDMIVEGVEEGVEGFAWILQGLITFVISALPVAGLIALVLWLLTRFLDWRRNRSLV